MAWLGHPVTVIALVTLIVNDHLLKAAHPGWVTGKLSDAAGLVLAPALLAVLTRLRAPAAIAVVAVGFTTVKAVPYAAGLASAAWTAVAGPSLVRADLTDLLTLPALGLCWWAWRSASRHPAPPQWVRAARIGLLLPLALVGVAATSAGSRPLASRVAVEANTIYLGAHDQWGWSWSLSLDQGVTWTPAGEDETAGFTTRFLLPVTRSCSVADPRICYRVMPGELGVEASNDGGATWTISWQANAAERKELARRHSEPAARNPELSSVALGVRDVPGGHLVVVANGLDGFRQRDPDGTWRRIGMPALFGRGEAVRPTIDEPGSNRRNNSLLVVGVASLLAGLVIGVGGARARQRRGLAYLWCLPVLLGTIATLPLVSFARGPDEFFGYAGPALSTGCSLLAAVLISGLPLGRVEGRAQWALRVWGAGLLTALIGAAACSGWLTGLIPGSVAVLLCLAALAPGLLIALPAAAQLRPALAFNPDVVDRR